MGGIETYDGSILRGNAVIRGVNPVENVFMTMGGHVALGWWLSPWTQKHKKCESIRTVSSDSCFTSDQSILLFSSIFRVWFVSTSQVSQCPKRLNRPKCLFCFKRLNFLKFLRVQHFLSVFSNTSNSSVSNVLHVTASQVSRVAKQILSVSCFSSASFFFKILSVSLVLSVCLKCLKRLRFFGVSSIGHRNCLKYKQSLKIS